MLLYEGREAASVRAVRFSPGGECFAAATEAGAVRWFAAGEQIAPRGGCDTGLEIDDIAFDPSGRRLAVVGRARKPDTGYPESALSVLILRRFAETPGARHRLPEKIDGRVVGDIFAAPLFLPQARRRFPLLVGTVDGVLGIEPASGEARFRVVTSNDFGFVARRGLVYVLKKTLLVFYDMHPGLWLMAYPQGTGGNFPHGQVLYRWADGHLAGAALSPSGARVAFGIQDDFYVHPAEVGAGPPPLGIIQVYDTGRLGPAGRFEVSASIERDFGELDLAPGDGRRQPLGGGPDSPFVYLPLSMMSSPAFLDDRRLAYGMPGGEVRVLDIQTRQVGTTLDGGRAAVGSVDGAPAKELLAAGSADGTLRVWRCRAGESPGERGE